MKGVTVNETKLWRWIIVESDLFVILYKYQKNTNYFDRNNV